MSNEDRNEVRTAAKVEQRHRVDYSVSDSHEASALLSALRNMHCDRPHSIFGPPCERCLSTVHDALAKAICVIRTDAEQRGRDDEREECAVLCDAQDSCETDLGWTDCPKRYAAAIRARGQRKEDSE